MFAVMEKFQGVDTLWAYEFAPKHKNQSHLGWVIEFNFVGKLFNATQRTHCVALSTISNEPADFIVLTAVYFEIDTPLWSSSKWIVPRSSSEIGFDAVGFWEGDWTNVLRFIQFMC
jgi:hypothetical protein